MRGRYIGDEPDGLVPAPILAEAYQRIHQIDSRPVFSIFGSVVPYHQHKGAYWKDYVNSSDIVGFDAYPFGPTIPVPGGDGVELGCRSFEQSLSGRCFRNLSVIAEAVDGVTNFAPAARKPIWLVDQTMGNRELFRREPSAQEERAVTYLALIHGASGTLMTHPSSGPFPKQLDTACLHSSASNESEQTIVRCVGQGSSISCGRPASAAVPRPAGRRTRSRRGAQQVLLKRRSNRAALRCGMSAGRWRWRWLSSGSLGCSAGARMAACRWPKELRLQSLLVTYMRPHASTAVVAKF